ncbi:MAG: S41 family peptidase [Cellulosilyticaceae bacterium]
MREKKKWFLGVGVGCLVGAIVVGIGFVGVSVTASPREQFSKRKAANLEMLVQKYYMGDVKSMDMLEGVYKGYVFGLNDPGTRYLTKDEYDKESVAKKGEYLGTGIEFTWGISSQNLIVTGVVPDSPAEQAGIVVGDKIVAIDGIKTMMSNEVHIYEKLTYVGNDPVKYTMTNNAGKSKGDILLQADVVDKVLIESRMVGADVGYIKINSLPKDTVNQIKGALEALKGEGARKLVLDLRGAESNDLEEVKKLADLFVEHGDLLRVEGKNDKVTTLAASKGGETMPLGVIINRYTTGAIEGFVDAIKFLQRGVVVGEPTSGKGTIQELIPLEDGSGLYVTTQKLIGSEGTAIQDKGVQPDLLERVPTENTLEIVTTGKLQDANDVLLQKTIETLQ